jgi:hypothetical protein
MLFCGGSTGNAPPQSFAGAARSSPPPSIADGLCSATSRARQDSSHRLGSVLAHYHFAHPVRTVRLDGNDLVALLPRAIVVLNARTGALKRSWKVAKQTRLEDAAGGVVLYIVGGQIRVRRLADGRDRAIPLPDNAKGPLHAQLEPAGLFYSWTLPLAPDDVLPEGRLGFAPMSSVAGLF